MTERTAAADAPTSVYRTAAEAAAYLRATRGTIYNLAWRGVLPRRRGKLLFTRQELDDYLAGKGNPRGSRTGYGESGPTGREPVRTMRSNRDRSPPVCDPRLPAGTAGI